MSLTLGTISLSRRAAQILIDAAQGAARSDGIAVAVAVVDCGGHAIIIDRMDGAANCAVPLALSKAETAAATLAATENWFHSTQPGQRDWGMNVPLGGRYNAMPGGLPVAINGQMAGAIGVSGGEATQDARCAAAALATLTGIRE